MGAILLLQHRIRRVLVHILCVTECAARVPCRSPAGVVRVKWGRVVSGGWGWLLKQINNTPPAHATQFAKCFPSHCSLPGHGRSGGVAGGAVCVSGCRCAGGCFVHPRPRPAASSPARTHAAIASARKHRRVSVAQPGQPVVCVIECHNNTRTRPPRRALPCAFVSGLSICFLFDSLESHVNAHTSLASGVAPPSAPAQCSHAPRGAAVCHSNTPAARRAVPRRFRVRTSGVRIVFRILTTRSPRARPTAGSIDLACKHNECVCRKKDVCAAATGAGGAVRR